MRKRPIRSNTSRRPPATGVASPPPLASVAAAGDTGVSAHWPWLLLVLSVVFNAVALWPELTSRAPRGNDQSFHLLMIRGASEALAGAGNPLDFWIPQLELGFPQFLYYQHLPHLVLAALHRVSAGTLSVEGLFHGTQYLLLVAMPCTVSWSMHRMGFSAAASAVGGVVSTLLSANDYLALEYNSYIWQGFGMFSQLCGIHLFFITSARLMTTMRTGTGYAGSAAWLAALVLSHLLLGALMAATSVLLCLADASRHTLAPRVLRLAMVGVGAFALSAYMIVPFVASASQFLNGVGESSGAVQTRTGVVISGGLLDFGRVPVLTVAAIAGLVAAAVAWRQRADVAARLVTLGLPVWTVLYVVRPGVGLWSSVLPGHTGAASFRYSSMVGVFAILAIGYGAGCLWTFLTRARKPGPRWWPAPARAAVAMVVFLCLLAPAVQERWGYFDENRAIQERATRALASDPDVRSVLGALGGERAGRTFAGFVRGFSCPMAIGRAICLSDLLNAQGTTTVGNPMQKLALSSGLAYDFPVNDPAMYDLLDIRRVVAPTGAATPSFYEPQARFFRHTIYRVATSGAVQYVAVTARQATRDQNALWAAHVQWLRSGGATRREVVRWDYHRPPGPLALRTGCAAPAAARENITTQRLIVDVQCAAPEGDTLAIAFKMTYHPQWQVTVDGAPVPTYMVSPGFLAVDVLPGRHRLDARYAAHPWKLPLLIGGILLFAGLCARSEWADRPARWWMHRSAAAAAPPMR